MPRTLSGVTAGVVEQLELDGELLVTVDRLATAMQQAGMAADESAARRLGYELQRDGWLGRLRTRHVWEFLPGARGGAYGSGDRLIEFRAQHSVNPHWSGVLAMESAALVLGLAQRFPEREVVALAPQDELPKALVGDWRLVRLAMPDAGVTNRDGLPTWTLEALIVGIAARPSAYRDVAGLAQWLPQVAGRVEVETVVGLLAGMRAATRQRAGYLLGAGGNAAARSALARAYPATSPVWLGPREAGAGIFDPQTQVNDTILHKYLSVGTGS